MADEYGTRGGATAVLRYDYCGEVLETSAACRAGDRVGNRGSPASRLQQRPLSGSGRGAQGALPELPGGAQDARSGGGLHHRVPRGVGEHLRHAARVPLPEAPVRADPGTRAARAPATGSAGGRRRVSLRAQTRRPVPGRSVLRAVRRWPDARGGRGGLCLRARAHCRSRGEQPGDRALLEPRGLSGVLRAPKEAAHDRSRLPGAEHARAVRPGGAHRGGACDRTGRARDRADRSLPADLVLVHHAVHGAGAVGSHRVLRRQGRAAPLLGPSRGRRALPDEPVRQAIPDRSGAEPELVRRTASGVARARRDLPD